MSRIADVNPIRLHNMRAWSPEVRQQGTVEQFAWYLADALGTAQVVSVNHTAKSPPDVTNAVSLWKAPHLEAALTIASGAAAVVACPLTPQTPDPQALQRALGSAGVTPAFVGHAVGGQARDEPSHIVGVISHAGLPSRESSTSGFRVVAFVPTYNEEDIIDHTLRYLIGQGIEVYVIDNWSSDGTYERSREYLGRGVIGIERFPPERPLATYEWRLILGRVEELAAAIPADWFMLHDADERRSPPWPDTTLPEGLQHAERCGFNCVDHVVLNFWPTDDRPMDPSHDVEAQLRYFEFSDHLGHFHQRKAWKRTPFPVSLAASAGHDVAFPGRLVYPFKFLIKHYPIRSEAHGRRKVLRDRINRWSPRERAFGWHQQYDQLVDRPSFVRDALTLERFDEATFLEKHVIPRLSGIGVFPCAPDWATGPRETFAAPR